MKKPTVLILAGITCIPIILFEISLFGLIKLYEWTGKKSLLLMYILVKMEKVAGYVDIFVNKLETDWRR